MDNVKVLRQTPFGDYEYVTLRKVYIREYEEHGFSPHICWKVDNGNSWHFENLTFEHFLTKNGMEVM